MTYSIFISCPKGLEYLLEEEMRTIGLTVSHVNPQGVYGEANLETLYKICLHSRIGNRVQLILFSGNAENQKDIYQLCLKYDWQSQFLHDKTFSIEFHGSSDSINNTMFGAHVIKDAIVDYFRNKTNTRPSINKENPQIKVHAHLKKGLLTVSLDMTGYSMHQRGYRKISTKAPIKENVAAAMLIRAKWPEEYNNGKSIVDPFCGSGTILIEAAMMAANIAPGLIRSDQSFINWSNHNETLWNKLIQDAKDKIKRPPATIKFFGSDIDKNSLEIAKDCAALASVSSWIEFKNIDCVDLTNLSNLPFIIICNPPYGERLSDEAELTPLYQKFGEILYNNFQGSSAYILTSNQNLAKAISLKSHKKYKFYNGALECNLFCFEITENNQLKKFNTDYRITENAEMFANRLKKNFQHMQKWAKRNNITCYRVYDADLPEYAYAIDIYQNFAVLQEYQAPSSIPERISQQRSLDVVKITPNILNIPHENIVHKQRKKQRGENQYTKIASNNNFIEVQEGNAKLKVNLQDYLDTGLFLDHRPLRLKFTKLTPGLKFLNCFCYTASASVHAALNGAITTNIDLSNTYLGWAINNFKLNNINTSRHQFVQYDCLEWLKLTKDKFDVIFLDPPSFSNSKRMEDTLDIQRDHEELIRLALGLLNPNGSLYFSTNLRNFKISSRILEQFIVQNITKETIDVDFRRNTKIHQCFHITNDI